MKFISETQGRVYKTPPKLPPIKTHNNVLQTQQCRAWGKQQISVSVCGVTIYMKLNDHV